LQPIFLKINTKALEPFILIKSTEQIFNFALLLGVIQIITGKILNAVKQMMQSGFMHGIATFGITLFVLCLAITGSTMLGAKPGNILKYTPYGMYFGLFLIFFFNSPGKNILFNLANGIWVMYGVVTGFFGDLLSYIRLFALGVSGGILGLVINDMSHQFLAIPIVGPVLFLALMLGGHSLNIALSGLGAFVHPMRLTFVEFFNNSGFSGPGIAYKPFGKHIK
jgi:V/A-type H+-transporting ATPase subunit I